MAASYSTKLNADEDEQRALGVWEDPDTEWRMWLDLSDRRREYGPASVMFNGHRVPPHVPGGTGPAFDDTGFSNGRL